MTVRWHDCLIVEVCAINVKGRKSRRWRRYDYPSQIWHRVKFTELRRHKIAGERPNFLDNIEVKSQVQPKSIYICLRQQGLPYQKEIDIELDM